MYISVFGKKLYRKINNVVVFPFAFLHKICKQKANLIGHILRRNSLLQRVIEGKTKGRDRSDRKAKKKT
jgi:hypothetical protein